MNIRPLSIQMQCQELGFGIENLKLFTYCAGQYSILTITNSTGEKNKLVYRHSVVLCYLGEKCNC